MLGTSILHHSMEGTSSNGISNSTHNRGSQHTCARTESSMAEQYEYIASMAPPFCRFPDDGKQPLAQEASGLLRVYSSCLNMPLGGELQWLRHHPGLGII